MREDGEVSDNNPRPVGLFIGLSTLDVIQLVERVPHSDEKVRALDISLAAGGPAANAAVAFAGLGGRAVLITRIADDSASALIRADLAQYGVEIIDRFGSAGSTTVASILVTQSSGERAVVSAADRGRSDESTESPVTQADWPGLLDDVAPDIVLIDSYEIDISGPIAEHARKRGLAVVLDCGGKKPYTETQLTGVDVAVVSERYLDGGAEIIAADIRRFDVPFGAVTAGGEPVVYWAGESELATLPVERVDHVVDTLGAGDFFHGALAYYLARQPLTATSLRAALGSAAKISAISVQEFGSRSWIAKLRQLRIE